jgi:hypothetical protein
MTLKKILQAAEKEAAASHRPELVELRNYSMPVNRVMPSLQQATIVLTLPAYFSPSTVESAMQDFARENEHTLNWKTTRYANDSDPVFACGSINVVEPVEDDLEELPIPASIRPGSIIPRRS